MVEEGSHLDECQKGVLNICGIVKDGGLVNTY